MGKLENDEFLPSSIAAAEAASIIEANNNNIRRENRGCFCNFNSFINIKCIFTLLLGFSVFISAIFWLPPFFNFSDFGDNDLDSRYRGHAILASFKLQKPVSFVKDNVLQLEADIYNELPLANAKVKILSLEDSGLNLTDVVFGIDFLSKRSKITTTQLSLIRSDFGSFVTREAELALTTSLFGELSIFELLKFPGGITITPLHQNAFPLQTVQISFNFTLNNSILQIQDNFEALVHQLKSGLHLARQETLYISLTNYRGSTVAPPTTVQTSVVLTVGLPSVPRMKQLAKTIKDSPAKNLGLNNTVFGKVKQVSLSSILPAGGSGSPTSAPTPGPIPHFTHHHHHQHHHHATAPSHPPTRTPQPAPQKRYEENPHGAPAPYKDRHTSPPGVRSSESPRHSPARVAVAPSMSDHHPSAPSPHWLAKPPSPVIHPISPSGHLTDVIYTPAPPDKTPQVSPLQSSGGRIKAAHWILSLSVALLLRLR